MPSTIGCNGIRVDDRFERVAGAAVDGREPAGPPATHPLATAHALPHPGVAESRPMMRADAAHRSDVERHDALGVALIEVPTAMNVLPARGPA